MRKYSTISFILLACLVPSLHAHHSNAMFDDKVELIMTGVVTKFDYVNPHSWLYIDVTAEDGSITQWGFELSAPPRLRRIGVSPNYWKEGDLIMIKTNPLRDGRPAGGLKGMIKSDGVSFKDTTGLTAPKAE